MLFPLATLVARLAFESVFLLVDHRALGCLLCVESGEVFPFLREVVLVEDRLDRALRNTGLAVDALIRMDIEHLCPFIEAIDRADNDTIGVLAVEARLGDNVSHS
jgi:hypothetical protein